MLKHIPKGRARENSRALVVTLELLLGLFWRPLSLCIFTLETCSVLLLLRTAVMSQGCAILPDIKQTSPVFVGTVAYDCLQVAGHGLTSHHFQPSLFLSHFHQIL